MKEFKYKKIQAWGTIVLMIVVAAFGTIFTVTFYDLVINNEQNVLLTRARIAAESVRAQDIEMLAASKADLGNAAYADLKVLMLNLKNAQSDVRFVYLMGRNSAGEVFFYVDSEAPESRDYSAPGDIYFESTEAQRRAFDTGESFVEGPVPDEWGNWVSGFSPIIDPSTGNVVALLGIDIPAHEWNERIFPAILGPISITLGLLVILFFYFLLIRRTSHYVARLQEMDQMKSEFVSLTSHQLRTPLTDMKWLIELLMEDSAKTLTDEQKKYIGEISEGSKRISNIVEEIIDVSHIEAGNKFAIEKKSSDLIKIIDSAIQSVAMYAERSKVSIAKSADFPISLTATVDERRLLFMFHSLLTNAIAYSGEDSVITVGYEQKSGEHAFYVKDSGIGIPRKEQPRVFEKFFRGSNARVKIPDGSGVGLFIAKAVMEKHGGKLTFTSDEGRGSTFFVALPV